MKTAKAQRISPARPLSTEKARKDALAEIQKRLDAPEPDSAAKVGGVAPTGDATPEGEVTAKAGSPRPPAATSGRKGGKKGAAPKPEKEGKQRSATVARSAKEPKVAKEAKPKRLSCINAAAQVLAKSKEPMKAKEMIEAMGKQGLWNSPKGKTPEASLYAAIIREIAAKGVDARFVKTDRGSFAAAGKGR